ncbi:short chain dehydrogenase reductase [Apiospora arundinis]
MSAYNLQGKVAIVTGAGSGKWLRSPRALLDSGCSVVFADLALRAEAEATIQRFPHPPPVDGRTSALYHRMDQSDWSEIQGTETPSSSFWHAPSASIFSEDDPNGSPGNYKTLAVNLLGPIRFAQVAIDYWLRNKIPGNLLFISSLSVYLPSIGTPLYNASKGGLVSFAQSLAQMRQRLGVRVAVMCPATTFTPAVLHEYCSDKVREQNMNMTPAECARVMLDLVTLPQYGNGNIVEAMQFGQKDQPSDVRVREVPYPGLAPSIDSSGDYSGRNIAVVEEQLWKQLEQQS